MTQVRRRRLSTGTVHAARNRDHGTFLVCSDVLVDWESGRHPGYVWVAPETAVTCRRCLLEIQAGRA